MRGQRDVMLELGLLAAQIRLLDGVALLLGQQHRLVAHRQRDRAQRQDQRRDGQEYDFLPQLHERPPIRISDPRDFTPPRVLGST